MVKRIIWLLASCLMAISLVVASCGTAVEEEEEEKEIVTPADDTPKYGGTYNLAQGADPTNWHPSWVITGSVHCLLYQHMWEGDWTKGPAGGYGTNETDWTGSVYSGKFRDGRIAESWELPTKIEGETGALIFHIRQGVHWALNPASEAGRLVGGREVTADDVVYTLTEVTTNRGAYLYRQSPELRDAKITSPDEWTVQNQAGSTARCIRCGPGAIH